DPRVGGPELTMIGRDKIGTEMLGERVAIADNREKARPDVNGNYLFEPNTDGLSQVNAHTVTTSTLDLFEHYRGGRIDWAFGSPTLDVVPHKQEGRNAYYSRWEGSTNFFFFDSQELGVHVKTANSADVVSHETGHAILDGMKPGYFGTWDEETGGFHEAFGDCAAMLYNLQQGSNRQKILDQTGGNLRTPNILAGLAEEFGKALKMSNQDPNDDNREYLRTALNPFKYKPPSEYPPGKGTDEKMTREVHSFSRIFSGAFYDMIDGIYQQGVFEEKKCPIDALQYAADVAGPLFVRGIELSPSNQGRYRDIALSMLQVDTQLYGGKYGNIIKKAFLDREILKPEDIQNFEKQLAALPDLRLDKPLASDRDALAFVKSNADKLNVPADANYQVQNVYKNGKGETFVNIAIPQEVPVTGVSGFEGFTTDVNGGLTLAFDASGKLFNLKYTPVTPQTVAEEMQGIAFLKDTGKISTQTVFQSTNAAGSIFKGFVQGKKLVRVPVANECAGHDH
ncbi:MAG: hypothetical protein AB1758_32455, partial [Candidatus Eremiobacterota bacterium]